MVTVSITTPYGSWPSPITATAATAGSPRLDGAMLRGDEIWWGQSKADEGGRTAVLRRFADGTVEDVLPAPWNARSRVHEYGGGSWTVASDGTLYFVEKTDQRVWALDLAGAQPRPLTPVGTYTRHGGLTLQNGRLFAVREIEGGDERPRRAIIEIALDSASDVDSDSAVTVVADGSDFLAQPALSPDGQRLAWVAWDHPDMPWDRSRILVAPCDRSHAPIALTSGETSALQPLWIDASTLLYLDDASGRWNIWHTTIDDRRAPFNTGESDSDTGGGLWVLGVRWYGAFADGRVLAIRTHGDDELVVIGQDGIARPVRIPARTRLVIEHISGDRALVSGAAPGGSGIWLVTAEGAVTLVAGGPGTVEAAWLPTPRAITVDGPHGEVHAYAYPPTHPDAHAPVDELAPYVVLVHGGPTAHVGGVADARTAYFTSRGIGVLDVNYGGSTGYGRAYRERLKGQWGVVDVDDVAAAASGLASAGLADPHRLAIAGGSAGGWTVLAALVRTDVFGAGISRYGIGDARTLAEDTHDFESRYLDGLIGPLPEAEAVYVERSPLTYPERFRVPMLLLQGEEDAVVPPAQAEAIRDTLRRQGVPHAYVLYPGEGHGFRSAATMAHALESELAFLGQVFGFATPGVPPLELEVGSPAT